MAPAGGAPAPHSSVRADSGQRPPGPRRARAGLAQVHAGEAGGLADRHRRQSAVRPAAGGTEIRQGCGDTEAADSHGTASSLASIRPVAHDPRHPSSTPIASVSREVTRGHFRKLSMNYIRTRSDARSVPGRAVMMELSTRSLPLFGVLLITVLGASCAQPGAGPTSPSAVGP